ncbi:hypothetical protein [Shewanella algae]|uniref:hypothetical protein n=1 Tax=Shewanella algae TaxID=38313 RepID=UPI0031F5049E
MDLKQIKEPEGEDLTKEEEAQLSEAMKISQVIIHREGETGDKIAAMVREDQDVARGIGNATATVLIAVGRQLQYSDDIKLILAMEILMELTALAVDAGALAEDEVNDEFIDAAASNAYSAYISAKEAMGELDVNELKQSVEEATKEGEALGIVPKQQTTGLLNRKPKTPMPEV